MILKWSKYEILKYYDLLSSYETNSIKRYCIDKRFDLIKDIQKKVKAWKQQIKEFTEHLSKSMEKTMQERNDGIKSAVSALTKKEKIKLEVRPCALRVN